MENLSDKLNNIPKVEFLEDRFNFIKNTDEVEDSTESLDSLISQLEQAEEEECESCKI